MEPVNLFVDSNTFDPKAISMSAVMTILRLQCKCAIRDYITHDLVGYFQPTDLNPWGYIWTKAQKPLNTSYRDIDLEEL